MIPTPIIYRVEHSASAVLSLSLFVVELHRKRRSLHHFHPYFLTTFSSLLLLLGVHDR